MFYQLVSLVGASLLLGAYLAINRRWLKPHHRRYNLMNLFGGALLLWVAIVDQRIGFMVLEGAWAAIAIPPLIRPKGEAVAENERQAVDEPKDEPVAQPGPPPLAQPKGEAPAP